LIGFAVFFAGSIWCGLAADLPELLVGPRSSRRRRLRHVVLSRAIARDMFSGAALARAMALIMIAMAADPVLAAARRALDHAFGWRLSVLVAAFAALGAVAYGTVFGETHHATRPPLDPLAIAKNYIWPDRRPPLLVPGRDGELVMGGLFPMSRRRRGS